jgi:rhamnosyltransferase
MNAKFNIIIPLYNAEKYIKNLIEKLLIQTIQPKKYIFIDSSSSDNTVAIVRSYGIEPYIIAKKDFNHGGTRQFALTLSDADFFVYLTQDAYPYDKFAIENIIKPFFENKIIGCVYGRQVPHLDANPLAKHARLFNYPKQSKLKTLEHRNSLKFKTCFNSNSFAAYRKTAITEVGGFPNHMISSEETFVSAKMLVSGWFLKYEASAIVHHSHNYTFSEEFKRYFDIGTTHIDERWILDTFNGTSKEGFKYLKSEFVYLIKNFHFKYLFSSFLSCLSKFLGYKLGLNHKKISIQSKLKLSMHSFYWKASNDKKY